MTFPTGPAVQSAGTEAKRPRVLFHHAIDMQKEYEYEPLITQYEAKAVCCKVTSHWYFRVITEYPHVLGVASSIDL